MKIDDGVREVLINQRRLGHDSNQLLIEIMERWGGCRAFADALFIEFQAARPGSLIRQNLLEMIQKLVVNNTNHNITKIAKPSDLDDEELESELEEMFKRAIGFNNARLEAAPETQQAEWQKEEYPVDDGG